MAIEDRDVDTLKGFAQDLKSLGEGSGQLVHIDRKTAKDMGETLERHIEKHEGMAQGICAKASEPRLINNRQRLLRFGESATVHGKLPELNDAVMADLREWTMDLLKKRMDKLAQDD